MIAPNAPCKDCPDRYVGCHGKCEKYLAYKEAMIQFKLDSNKKNEIDAYQKQSAAKHKMIKENKKYWKRRYVNE